MCPHVAYIVEPLGLRPVLAQDAAAPSVLLDLPNRVADARALQAQFQAADPGEQTADPHDITSSHADSSSVMMCPGVGSNRKPQRLISGS